MAEHTAEHRDPAATELGAAGLPGPATWSDLDHPGPRTPASPTGRGASQTECGVVSGSYCSPTARHLPPLRKPAIRTRLVDRTDGDRKSTRCQVQMLLPNSCWRAALPISEPARTGLDQGNRRRRRSTHQATAAEGQRGSRPLKAALRTLGAADSAGRVALIFDGTRSAKMAGAG